MGKKKPKNDRKYIALVCEDIEIIFGATFDEVTETFAVGHELNEIEDRHGFCIARGCTGRTAVVLEQKKPGLFAIVPMSVQKIPVFSKE